jgi:hypothetical protein
MASRMAARSTTHGTPVKSCSRTRAGHERDFLFARSGGIPLRERGNVVGLDERVVLAAQQILEQDLHRVRQPGNVEASFGQRGQAVDLHRLSADADISTGAECVRSHELR